MGNICNSDANLLLEEQKIIHLSQENPDALLHNKRFKDNSVKTGKYTWWNFLPLNLLQQFKKAPNIYFLICSFLQTIDLISISNGRSSTAPSLVQVVLVSMIKDAYEEYKKHRQDVRENNSPCWIFDSIRKVFQYKTWKDIHCGNILKIEQDQPIPCDVILLTSTDEKGIAFVETKNLDGETNLKQKTTQKNLLEYFLHDDQLTQKFVQIEGQIDCEGPNNQIYKFDGAIDMPQMNKVSLNADNILLKGSILRNTDFVYGIVVYTGHHTKLMMNSAKPKNKISDLERLMNNSIIIILITQFILACIAAAVGVVLTKTRFDNVRFLLRGVAGQESIALGWLILQLVGSWILMLTNFVPISLIVTLELVKFWQGMFMSLEWLMYDPEQDRQASCNSSNLNEQLGQVEYIFSDKTGTLTCNVMEFRKFTAGYGFYGTNENGGPNQESNVNFYDPQMQTVLHDPTHPNHLALKKVILHLALCHTIIIDEKKGKYNSASPDELALVNAAKQFGYEFKGLDRRNFMGIEDKLTGQQLKYQLLNVLEFTSARKRMSVILREPSGKVLLICKGADSIIAERLTETSLKSKEYKQTQLIVDQYATEGLRTLYMAERYIDENEYQNWNNRIQEASLLLQGREEKMEEINDEIEWSLELTGSTAIEDKLQDCVGDTIRFVKDAGIKVWVLTGDKVGTAINIGVSAGLLDQNMDQYMLEEETENEIQLKLQQIFPQIQAGATNGHRKQAIIIGGATLTLIIGDDNLRRAFVHATDYSDVVLACRVSPKQKADIVNLIKLRYPRKITLAIGDGANDVNMILQAHVGIGIFGKEGQQAARSADYSIGQFKFLKPLMFIHGREAYRRNSFFILYNFYKNILYISCQYVFGLWSSFSAQVLYEPFIYQMYNITFTSIPIMFYALFDFEYEKYCPLPNVHPSFYQQCKYFMNNPELYRIGIDYSCFSYFIFTQYLLYGLFQGIIVYILGFQYICHNDMMEDGKTLGFWVSGHVAFGACIIVCNLMILFRYHSLNGWSEWCSIGMILNFFTILYWQNLIRSFDQVYYIFSVFMEQPLIWLQLIAICLIISAIELGYFWTMDIVEHYRDERYKQIQYTPQYIQLNSVQSKTLGEQMIHPSRRNSSIQNEVLPGEHQHSHQNTDGVTSSEDLSKENVKIGITVGAYEQPS